MRMKAIFKRGISFLLSLIMILSVGLGPLPGGIFTREVQAAENYTLSKEELALGANVLSKALSEDEGFLDRYVRTDGTSMSVTKEFQLDATKNVKNASDTLSRNKMMHKKNKEGWYAHYTWTIPEQFKNSGYELVYEGNVIADDHYNVFINANDHWDVGIARINGIWELKAEKKDDEKAQPVKYVMDGSKVGWKNVLKFEATHSGCSCGSSAVSGSTFYMVEKTIPTVQRIYITSDAAGTTTVGGFSF